MVRVSMITLRSHCRDLEIDRRANLKSGSPRKSIKLHNELEFNAIALVPCGYESEYFAQNVIRKAIDGRKGVAIVVDRVGNDTDFFCTLGKRKLHPPECRNGLIQIP